MVTPVGRKFKRRLEKLNVQRSGDGGSTREMETAHRWAFAKCRTRIHSSKMVNPRIGYSGGQCHENCLPGDTRPALSKMPQLPSDETPHSFRPLCLWSSAVTGCGSQSPSIDVGPPREKRSPSG